MRIDSIIIEVDFSKTDEETISDININVYNVINDILNGLFPDGYYEEEGGKKEVVDGNTYLSWNIYRIENDEVISYTINVSIYWDGSGKIEISGPNEVSDPDELKSLLYVIEQVGNTDDTQVVKKYLES